MATRVFRARLCGGVVADVNEVLDELEAVFVRIERAATLSDRLQKLSANERLYAVMLQRRLRYVVRDLCKEALEILRNYDKGER